ncbi:MAG: sigma-70 family RNA polymerase sigma factor [Planctomycetes bacterium]|nr:sigma-70 family RNA polymerase sigma factor [Planctomycetota bacterium]
MEQASLLDATDLPLVRRFKAGDHQAFNELVRRYEDRIFNTICRMVGKHDHSFDIAQDTFVNAYRALPTFNERSGFYTWLYRIAVNNCLSFLRAKKRSREVSVRSGPGSEDDERTFDPPDPTPGPVQPVLDAELARKVQEAVQGITEEFRAALVLRYVEGLSYEEIADSLECPIGTVRSRIHRGLEEMGRNPNLLPLLEE